MRTETLGKCLFELQSQATTHHANAVEGIDDCFGICGQNVAMLEFNQDVKPSQYVIQNSLHPHETG